MMKKTALFIYLSLLDLGTAVKACTVCFGGADSKLKEGFTWGVLLLGSLPFILLSILILTVVLASRKHQPR